MTFFEHLDPAAPEAHDLHSFDHVSKKTFELSFCSLHPKEPMNYLQPHTPVASSQNRSYLPAPHNQHTFRWLLKL